MTSDTLVFLAGTFVATIVWFFLYYLTLKWVGKYVEKTPALSLFSIFLSYGLVLLFVATSAHLESESGDRLLWLLSSLLFVIRYATPVLMLIVLVDSLVKRNKSVVYLFLLLSSTIYLLVYALILMMTLYYLII